MGVDAGRSGRGQAVSVSPSCGSVRVLQPPAAFRQASNNTIMPTIKEIARRLDVSIATVSRALNNRGRVSKATQRRVLDMARELGYAPDVIARSLVSRGGLGIGLVVGDLDSPHYGLVMAAVEEELRRHGEMLVMANGRSSGRGEREAADFLRGQRCAAIILHAVGLSDASLIQQSGNRTPVIILNRHVEAMEGSCVWVDHARAGGLAAEHLLALGHRHIAVVRGPAGIPDAEDRHRGFLDRLAQANVAVSAGRVECGEYTVEDGYEAARRLLAGTPDFTAIFCANDNSAIGTIEACRDAGLRIPEDISVIGYDDTVWARHVVPPLTTVHIPVREMAHAAARLALSAVGKPVRRLPLHHEPALVVRESTAAPRALTSRA